MGKINFQKLEKLLPKIRKNVLLKNYTTFKIGGPAKYFFEAKNKEDIIKAIKAAKEFELPFFILGEGSNLLAADKGFKGLIIRIKNYELRIKNNIICAEAGVKLSDLVKLSLKNNLTGLEWATGIPGTVGGAVYGNTSAFGSLTAGIIESVEALDSKTLKIKTFSKTNCRFSDKDSIFKHKKNLVILSAVFKLKKGNKEKIENKIGEYLNYRKKSYLFEFVSAGCVFKNFFPVQGKTWRNSGKNQKLLKEFPELKEFIKKGIIPAGFLIEKCGLKGKRIGRAEISKKHGNFIVNSGNAKAKDALLLIKLIKEKVKNKFGIILEEEIEIL